VRGGTANCTVIISNGEIGSPQVEQADSLIILNHPSLEKFIKRIKAQGVCFINSSLVSGKLPGVKNFCYPFTQIALDLGDIRMANMVALGCYAAAKKIVQAEHVLAAMQDMAPQDKKNLLELNKMAFQAGMRLI